MAKEDVAVQDFIFYKIGSTLALAGVLYYFRRSIRYHTQQRLFAWLLNKLEKRTNRGLYKHKREIFQKVHEYKDSNFKGNAKGDLTVLEVGAGTAANLQFLPTNCKLTCLDPNPHFVGYMRKNLGKCDTVVNAEIIGGFAEDMPIEDDKFDIVVCTLVLCCVTSVEKCLKEIKRVLKPGGLFVFMEHVAAEEKSWTRLLQAIADPFHRVIGDGCNTQRETGKLIRNAGFKDLKLEEFRPRGMPIWLKPCIMGTASK